MFRKSGSGNERQSIFDRHRRIHRCGHHPTIRRRSRHHYGRHRRNRRQMNRRNSRCDRHRNNRWKNCVRHRNNRRQKKSYANSCRKMNYGYSYLQKNDRCKSCETPKKNRIPPDGHRKKPYGWFRRHCRKMRCGPSHRKKRTSGRGPRKCGNRLQTAPHRKRLRHRKTGSYPKSWRCDVPKRSPGKHSGACRPSSSRWKKIPYR